MAKDIYYNEEVRNLLKEGIDALANAVKVTLGPMGRNVIIDKGRFGHSVTKDGVSVAREIVLEDRVKNLGAEMIKEVSLNANDLAGDGTTTATVLAQAIVTEGLKNLSNVNPMDLKRGIDKAVNHIIKDIKDKAIQVDGDFEALEYIATISANNDNYIGSLITKAFKEVGVDGVVTVEKGKGLETSVDVVRGFKFKSSYLSPYFITDTNKKTVLFKKCKIMIYDGTINDDEFLFKLINPSGEPLLIVTKDINEEVLNRIVVKKLANKFKLAIVKAPYRLERQSKALKDLAVLTGASYLSEDKGHNLSIVNSNFLGYSEKVTIDSKSTTIVNGGGKKEAIEKRIAEIKAESETLVTSYEKSVNDERISKIKGGIAVIRVGAVSELELDEKKDRVDDALCAARAAIEEGYVIGSGLAIIRAAVNLPKSSNKTEQLGIDIIKTAVEEPFRQIMLNAGEIPDIILDKILRGKNKNIGYDAKKGIYVDMITEGIIDPVKVTRIALENAASIAGMILTTECALVNTENESQQLITF